MKLTAHTSPNHQSDSCDIASSLQVRHGAAIGQARGQRTWAATQATYAARCGRVERTRRHPGIMRVRLPELGMLRARARAACPALPRLERKQFEANPAARKRMAVGAGAGERGPVALHWLRA